MLFSIQFGSSRKVAVASWLFKAFAVAYYTTLGMCFLSYIGWQMENPVNCVENAAVLELSTLSLGWAVQEKKNYAGSKTLPASIKEKETHWPKVL